MSISLSDQNQRSTTITAIAAGLPPPARKESDTTAHRRELLSQLV